MGAQFYLPIHQMGWQEITTLLKKGANRLNVFSTSITQGTSCWEADLSHPLSLVIGSEAQGAGTEAHQLADENIHIPMPGNIESLNASIAAGILLFEVLRQRKL
jgi:tRNA G18 (ribose-2'-O)-methylase SpoU